MLFRLVCVFLTVMPVVQTFAATETPGVTAKLLSKTSIEGLYLAVQLDANAGEAFKSCIFSHRGSETEQEMQQSLRARFDVNELKEIDQFNSSPTGQRYQYYNLDFFKKSHGVTVANPVKLTAGDVRLLRNFEKTDAGRKYMTFLEDSTPRPDDPSTLAIQRIIDSCKK